MKQFADRWSKYLLSRLLFDVASVETGTDLLPDAFHVDILFCPKPGTTNYPMGIGLLQKLFTGV